MKRKKPATTATLVTKMRVTTAIVVTDDDEDGSDDGMAVEATHMSGGGIITLWVCKAYRRRIVSSVPTHRSSPFVAP
jgi:hypothetical protein